MISNLNIVFGVLLNMRSIVDGLLFVGAGTEVGFDMESMEKLFLIYKFSIDLVQIFVVLYR